MRQPRRGALSTALVFAFYCSLMFLFVEGTRADSGLQRYLFLWRPHAVSLRGSDFVLFYAELILVPAIVVLAGLTIASRVLPKRLLVSSGGAVAIAGFPLICLYTDSPWFLGVVELAVASICFLLWAGQKLPVSDVLNIFLLIVHYGFWFLYSGLLARVLRGSRPWDWGALWDYLAFLCPAVGFTYTLMWAAYYRDSGPAAE